MSKQRLILAGLVALTAAPLGFAVAGVPRALLVEGLWSDTIRLREACAAAGISYETAYESRSPYFNPDNKLFNMPEKLDRFDVVVLSNVDAPTLGSNRLAKIRGFVANGGGLVVLGGYWAFSNGGYAGTPLEDMVPVTMPARDFMPRFPDGLALTPGSRSPLPADAAYAALPKAYFVQPMTPKPGAEVWLRAGDKPAMIAADFEKGHVVALALTANGEAPAGALAFWDWPDWPRMLGAAIDWTTRNNVSKIAIKEAVKPLTREEVVSLAMGDAVSDEVVRRALANPVPETAAALFEYATSGGVDRKFGLADAVAALTPYAKPEWAAKLSELASFSNPDLPSRKAALVLLGATKDPSALVLLQQAANDRELKNEALEGMGLSGDPAFIPKISKIYKDAMRAARGGKETGTLLPEEFARQHAHTAAAAAMALYELGGEGAVEKVMSLFGDIQLYHEIFSNAGKRRVRWDVDPVGVEMVKAIWECDDRLKETLKKMRRQANVPACQRAFVVKAALTETRPVALEWLLLAFEHPGNPLTPADWKTLTGARAPLIARLAKSRLTSP